MKLQQALKPVQKRSSLRKVRGQGVLEYVLMMALLSTISMAFAGFFNRVLFGQGIDRLPQRASACMSHPVRGGPAGC